MKCIIALLLTLIANSTATTVYARNADNNRGSQDTETKTRRYNHKMEQIKEKIEEQIIHNPGSTLMKLDNVKEDACEMRHYNQTISKPRCNTREVPNTFCAGLCNSFDVPGEHPLKISRCCAATKTVQEPVFLDCPHRRRGNLKVATVTRVLACGCTMM